MTTTTKKNVASTVKVENKSMEQVDAAVAASKETVEAVVKAGTDVATKSYEKAVAITKENVDKAAKAHADAFKGYEDLVSFNKENIDAVVKSGSIMVKGFQDVSKAWMGLAQSSLEDSVANSKKFLTCKSLQEVVELQSGLAKNSYEAALTESKKLSEMSVKVTELAIEPIAARVNVAVEKFSKPLAA